MAAEPDMHSRQRLAHFAEADEALAVQSRGWAGLVVVFMTAIPNEGR
jgi:hypothetical protein